MSVQQNPVDYAEAIQAQLSTVVAPVPVYAVFNRNFATQPKFLTWQLRNVHPHTPHLGIRTPLLVVFHYVAFARTTDQPSLLVLDVVHTLAPSQSC